MGRRRVNPSSLASRAGRRGTRPSEDRARVGSVDDREVGVSLLIFSGEA